MSGTSRENERNDELENFAFDMTLEARQMTRVFRRCANCGHVVELFVSDELAEKENAIEQADSYLRYLLNAHLNSEHKAMI